MMLGQMSVFRKATAVNHTLFPEFKPFKVIQCSKLITLELISTREFVSRKLVFSEKWCRRPNTTMFKSFTTTSVFRESIGDEGIGGSKQQVFIDQSSSVFRPNFTDGGLESTLNHLSKWLLVLFFYMIILLRHDAKALWLILGANLNNGLSIILKQTLKQERPLSKLKSDPGMPSSHAQSIFFIVVVANLSTMEFLGVNGHTTTVAGILLAFGSYFAWLRVSQRFHTISQVVVGASLGSTVSVLWFWLWDAVVLKAFFSHLWIRLLVVFGGAGINLFFTFTHFLGRQKLNMQCRDV